VKFRDLLATARELGADVLATGHYVRSAASPGGRRALYRAADAARDQSYFLYATTQEQLELLRFPLGGLASKAETRALAERFGLSVADKADSQDICFVPEGRYSNLVERLCPEAAEPGDIVHTDGRILGQHKGIINYTVGQRRGLGITTGEPLYVVRIDARRRMVVVGPREHLHTRRILLKDANWIADEPFDKAGVGERALSVRVRSSQQPQPATLSIEGNEVSVLLRDGEHGIAAGQACVFYADATPNARVLGGGWIAASTIEHHSPIVPEGADSQRAGNKRLG
jgi:tRNA-specific 2-thiouridylase